jgi:hypothetical protein
VISQAASVDAEASAWTRRAVLIVFGLSGAVSLALEVLWFRVLVVFLRPTTDAARLAGIFYAVNVCGAILGAAGAGFLLIPRLGSTGHAARAGHGQAGRRAVARRPAVEAPSGARKGCRRAWPSTSAGQGHALKDDGVVLQWNGGVTATEYALILRTFRRAFPDMTLWGDGSLMLAMKGPLTVDLDAYRRKLADPNVRRVLQGYNLDGEDKLLRPFVATPEDVRKLVGDRPVTTDGRPLVESSIPVTFLPATK